MPFACMDLINDPYSGTLDGAGNDLGLSGYRYVDLQDVQYARISYTALVTSGAGTVANYLEYTTDRGATWAALLPAGPDCGTASSTVIGPWAEVPAGAKVPASVSIRMVSTGTPGAAYTVNWAHMQFR